MRFVRGRRQPKPNAWARFEKKSRSFFRPRLEALEDRTLLTTFPVTNTLDSGPGSLRQAILDANTNAGVVDTISFTVGTGVQSIQPLSPLPAITDPVVLDATQPGHAGTPLIELNGASAGAGANGLTLTAGGSTVTGFVINRFSSNGILIAGPAATGNLIVGNYIGTSVSGNDALSNGLAGVWIDGGANNTIGGASFIDPSTGLLSGQGNVLSGNANSGVFILGATGNLVQGNFINTNPTGKAAVVNSPLNNGVDLLDGASGNTVGGVSALDGNGNLSGLGNVIAACGDGILVTDLFGAGAPAANNVIAGNFIGIDVSGTHALGNDSNGIQLAGGAVNTTVGGTAAGLGNVISANGTRRLADANTGITLNTRFGYGSITGTLIQGNRIGTDVTGGAALANSGAGVEFQSGSAGGVTNNTVGGSTAEARNVISGNAGNGIQITGSGANNNVVAGNYIGTNVSGTAALPNGLRGVWVLNGATNNTVGGLTATPGTGAGNVISGNRFQVGVVLEGAGTNFNSVAGNIIGLDRTGQAALANQQGVWINAAANTVGGTAAEARNLISGNTFAGIVLTGSGATGNTVQGNYVGTDLSGSLPRGNDQGVVINGGASNNTVGGTATVAGNVLSGNTIRGVFLSDATTANNVVLGNFIGTNASGTAAVANAGQGVFLNNSPGNTIGGTVAGAGNVISGNGVQGILIGGASTTGNAVVGNFIGTNAAGTAALGNLLGISLHAGASNNTFGGTTAAARNIISGNSGGFALGKDDANPVTRNVIRGNYIGTDVTGMVAVGNHDYGVAIGGGAADNTVGGTAAGAGNVISGSVGNGVWIWNTGSNNNLIQGNYIGTNKDGTAALGNASGVVINGGASNNLVGGGTPAARNVISGNGWPGVGVFDAGTNNNKIQGNYIGLNPSGTASIPNVGSGVAVYGGPTGTVIGTDGDGVNDAGEGNVISGNWYENVVIATSDNTVVAGNRIGTNADGSAARPGSFESGVVVRYGSRATRIGTNSDGVSDAYERNVISGNSSLGILVQTPEWNGAAPPGGRITEGTVIAGNYIGINAAGTAALGNSSGVVIQAGASNNLVGGGTLAARNVISGNNGTGVDITDTGTARNSVLGNYIGTNATGTAAIANVGAGVTVRNGAVATRIGVQESELVVSDWGHNLVKQYLPAADVADQSTSVSLGPLGIAIDPNGYRFIISQDGTLWRFNPAGILVNTIATGLGDTRNLTIGPDGNLYVAVHNTNQILRFNGTTFAAMGAFLTGLNGPVGLNFGPDGQLYVTETDFSNTGRLLKFNGVTGAPLGQVGSVNLRWASSPIWDAQGNIYLTERVGNTLLKLDGTTGALKQTLASGGILSGPEFLTFGPDGKLYVSAIFNNSVQKYDPNTGAFLGYAISPSAGLSLPHGIAFAPAAVSGNVISGNGSSGVLIRDSGTNTNWVAGNYIGTDATGTVNLGNGGNGIALVNAAGNTIGGTAAGAGNVISGNALDGINLTGQGTIAGGVSRFRADGSASDAIGSNHGTVHGGTTFVSGVSGQAFNFDGTGYVQIPHNSNLNVPQLTVAGWIKPVFAGRPSSTPDFDTIFSKGTGTGIGYGLFVVMDATAAFQAPPGGVAIGTIQFYADISNAGQALYSPAPLPNDGQYHHIAATYDGVIMRLYIDGVQVASKAVSGSIVTTTNDAFIGGQPQSPAPFNKLSQAAVDDVLLANRALTANEMALLYAARGVGTLGNLIQGNFIGTNAAGSAALANMRSGVFITDGATSNTVGGTTAGARNVISGNGGNGVTVLGGGAIGNQIRGNAIYANGGLGIDLGGDGVTANDPGDTGSGPNQLQNYPVLLAVEPIGDGASIRISGTLNSRAGTSFPVDFYASPAADPSGYGQGRYDLGSLSVPTDAAGNATFSVELSAANLPGGTIPDGWVISATATDPAGNTSEFAHDVALLPTVSFTVAGTGLSRTLTLGATGSPAEEAAGFRYTVAWGDGQVQVIEPTPGNGSGGGRPVVTHFYNHTDSYTVGVTAADQHGLASDEVSQAVTITVDPATLAADLQALLSTGDTVSLHASPAVTPATVLRILNALTGIAVPAWITLDLDGGTYSTDGVAYDPTDPDTAANVYLAIQNGTLQSDGPALTVGGGNVSVLGTTLVTTGDADTVVVVGGYLGLIDNSIEESPGYDRAALSLTGGSIGLENNVINVNGAGRFLKNESEEPVVPIGGTFLVNGAPPPAIPLSFTVTNTEDDGPGSLRQAIFDATVQGLLAAGRPSVTFAIPATDPGYDPTTGASLITLLSGPLSVGYDLDVCGPGADRLAVSGDHGCSVFEIFAGARVTLRDLAIRDGTSYGVLNDGLLTVRGVTLADNDAGIWNDGGTVTVDGSTIAGSASGGIVNWSGTLAVTGSSFTGNTGGGISNSYGTVTVADCRFSDNTAQFGGGIANLQGSLTVRGSTFLNNRAESGGGIYDFEDYTVSLRVLTVSDSTFAGNSATGDGGGIYSRWGSLTVSTSTFHDNPALRGGGIYWQGAGSFYAPKLTVRNSTFFQNSAALIGGGICAASSSFSPDSYGQSIPIPSSTLVHVTVVGNTALIAGGIASIGLAAPVLISNSIVAGNIVTNANGIAPDVQPSTVRSGGHNLIGVGPISGLRGLAPGDLVGTATSPLDPRLAPLGDYGGPTWTMRPLPGSPALDAGDNALAVDADGDPLAADQRGLSRIVGGTVDIGAFECQLPVANAGGPYAIHEGDSLTLDAGASFDPDGDALSYAWDVNGDGVYTDTYGVRPTLTWSQLVALGIDHGPSSRNVRVRVSDGVSNPVTSNAAVLIIDNLAPTPSIGGAPASSPEGTPIVLTASATDPSPADTAAGFTFTWHVVASNGQTMADGSGATFSFTPSDNGTYVVTLTATDKDSGSASTTATIVITNVAPPSASLSGPTNGVRNQPRTFTLGATDPSPTDQAAGFTYLLDWNGDGTTDESVSGPDGLQVTHAFPTAGTFTIRVTPRDKDGGTSAVATLGLTINVIEFQGSDLAVGGTAGDDGFVFNPGPNPGDVIVLLNNANLGTFHVTGAVQVWGGPGSDTVTINGDAAANTFVLGVGSISRDANVFVDHDVESRMLNGKGGIDRLEAATPGTNGWLLTGAGAGSLNGLVTFSSIQQLTGSGGDDTFAFLDTGSVSGLIDGGGGLDTLDYSAVTTAVTVNLQTGNATKTGGFTGIDHVIGGVSSQDKLVGPGVNSLWDLTGLNSGTVNGNLAFAGVENLTGGSAVDTFRVEPAGRVTGTLTGGGGADVLDYSAYDRGVTINLQAAQVAASGNLVSVASLASIAAFTGSAFADTLVGADKANTWHLTGTNAGSLGSLTWTGVENVTGGNQADSFRFEGGQVTGTVRGGGGADVLDYSTSTTGVQVNLQLGQAAGVGAVLDVHNVTGGAGSDVLIGDAQGNILSGRGGDDLLLGGQGDDVLDGGAGQDILVGGSGADQLTGGGGDDVLIGGVLTYFNEATGAADLTALAALMAEWARTDINYTQRIAHLSGGTPGGLNGAYLLSAATVADDATADVLTGSGGRDWFFANLSGAVRDTLTDPSGNETMVNIV